MSSSSCFPLSKIITLINFWGLIWLVELQSVRNDFTLEYLVAWVFISHWKKSGPLSQLAEQLTLN